MRHLYPFTPAVRELRTKIDKLRRLRKRHFLTAQELSHLAALQAELRSHRIPRQS